MPITSSFSANTSGPLTLTVASFNGIGQELINQPFGAVKDKVSFAGVIDALKGISLGGPTSYLGDGTFGRHMQVGVTENFTDGNPSAPCLQLTYPGFWRFRWSVKPGVRSVYIQAKQSHYLSGSVPYVNIFYPPTMVVKANSAVGLNNDISGSAIDTQGWNQIGPVSFTATAVGIISVELWNNNSNEYNTPCLFDHIICT